MVLFHDGLSESARRLLFIIFCASCIISHYSTSYIFFFILFLTCIGMEIIPRILRKGKEITKPIGNATGRSNHTSPPANNEVISGDTDESESVAAESRRLLPKKRISFTTLILFIVLLFFWFSQITEQAFNIGVTFMQRTFLHLNEWLLLESRGPTVTSALGKGIVILPQQIRVFISWAIIALVAIGVITTMFRYKKMISDSPSSQTKPDFLSSKFDMEFFIVAVVCSFILVFSIALPYILMGYSMERVYFQALVVLAPFFVIGAIVIGKIIRVKPHWITLPVLLLYFMCTTGVMYQIFGHQVSLALNSVGNKEYEKWYIQDEESYSAEWLAEYAREGILVYTDYGLGPRILMSQGGIKRIWLRPNVITRYQGDEVITGYIYLFYPDIVKGTAPLSEYTPIYISPCPELLVNRNRVYSNGLVEIYR
ncbi:DUF2206 domain-containing protein [Chloroflexota bacterium]